MTTPKLYLAHVLAQSASRVEQKLGTGAVPPRDILLGWVEGELSRRGIGLETDPLPAVQTEFWYLPAQAPFHPNTYNGSFVTVYRKVPGVTVPDNRFIRSAEYTDTVTVKILNSLKDSSPPNLSYSRNQLKDQVILEAVLNLFAGALVSNVLSSRWAHTRSAPAPAADAAWEAELMRLQEQVREVDSARSALHGRLKAWDRIGGPDRGHKRSMTEYRSLEQRLQSATRQYQAAQAALKAHKAKRPT